VQGRGGFGEVYECMFRGERVAVKQLPAVLQDGPAAPPAKALYVALIQLSCRFNCDRLVRRHKSDAVLHHCFLLVILGITFRACIRAVWTKKGICAQSVVHQQDITSANVRRLHDNTGEILLSGADVAKSDECCSDKRIACRRCACWEAAWGCQRKRA